MTLCLWCWLTTDALGWSKTRKNLRDRSFESRVEVCLQDLNFFKKYLQSWEGKVSCAQVFKVKATFLHLVPYLSVSHTPAEIQLISCKRRGEEKAAADGAVWGCRKQRRNVEPGAGWVLLQLSPALLIAVLFYSVCNNLRDSVKGGWNRSEWAWNCVWLVEKFLFFKHCVF